MRPLIAANWKMHGRSDWIDRPEQFNQLIPAADRQGVDALICPAFPYIAALKPAVEEAGVLLGAQNCHAEEVGAHTGDVSAEMLADIGAQYVIVGHSERRAGGETDDDVHRKAEAALRAGLIPIICVGEPYKIRQDGDAVSYVAQQLRGSLPDSRNIVIAYEPIWAIGTGLTAEPEDIAEMHAAIRAHVGDGVRILYGGSVKPGNAEAILKTENVNGALVGGASLAADSFAAIVKAAL